MIGRQIPRVSLNTPARVRTGSQEIKCCIVGLSASGMTLRTGKSDDFGRFIRITANLGDDSPRLDLDAIVHGKETHNGERRWRVEFHQPPPHVVTQIADYVRERCAAEAPAETSQAAGAADRAETAKQPPATDPEVQRLFELALKNIA